jgi:hypothetical protein
MTRASERTKGESLVKLPQWADDTLAEATGRERRFDPVLPGSGGPAGNARLTAWSGLLLLVLLFLVELGTLLNLTALIGWHVVVGVLLVPPALLKKATTGWRIVRYYTKRPPYHRAGPPPTLLRMLGPLVVIFTLALLGSGLALIALGPDTSSTLLLTVLGKRIDAVTVHQATFVLWAAVTGLHCAGRLVPAMRIVTSPRDARSRVPGRLSRATVLTLTLLVAGVFAAVVLGASSAWVSGGLYRINHHHVAGNTVPRS